MIRVHVAVAFVLALIAAPAVAADYPAPKQGDWIAKDFRFHTGETMPELRLHYTTIGEPTGQPVLVLHGSGGSAASMLTPAFAGEVPYAIATVDLDGGGRIFARVTPTEDVVIGARVTPSFVDHSEWTELRFVIA